MDYALADARIAERQRHYMAQGKDAATALRLAGADLPAEYEAYALRARDPAADAAARSDAERARVADGEFAAFAKRYAEAHPGASLSDAFEVFKVDFPTLAADYARVPR